MKPVPIPPTFDGENAVLYDGLETLLERLELIGEFDPKFAVSWCKSQLALPVSDEIDRELSMPWAWRGRDMRDEWEDDGEDLFGYEPVGSPPVFPILVGTVGVCLAALTILILVARW